MVGGGQRSSQGNGRDTLIGLVVLLVGALLVVIVRAVFSLLASADPAVLAAVVVTSGTVLVSVGSLIHSNRCQARQQAQQAQHDQKAEVYEELLTYWFWVMRERRNVPAGQSSARGSTGTWGWPSTWGRTSRRSGGRSAETQPLLRPSASRTGRRAEDYRPCHS